MLNRRQIANQVRKEAIKARKAYNNLSWLRKNLERRGIPIICPTTCAYDFRQTVLGIRRKIGKYTIFQSQCSGCRHPLSGPRCVFHEVGFLVTQKKINAGSEVDPRELVAITGAINPKWRVAKVARVLRDSL